MTISAGNNITAADINGFINNTQTIFTYFNETATVTDVSAGNIIDDASFDAARVDLVNLNTLLGTSTPTAVNAGTIITATTVNTYKSSADTALAQYTTPSNVLGGNMTATSNLKTQSYTSNWGETTANDLLSLTFTLTFGSSALQTAYFRTNGNFSFNPSFANGSGSDQDNNWSTLMNTTAPTLTVGYTQWNALTGSYTQIGSTYYGTGVYSTNTYSLFAYKTTTQVFVQARCYDPHESPSDVVTGDITIVCASSRCTNPSVFSQANPSAASSAGVS